jgi:hypothetical protein
MKYGLTVALILISVPLNVNSEVFKLADGRSVDLKSNGTYTFVKNSSEIMIEGSGCKTVARMEVDKDDFKNVVGYKYWTGFSLKYRIVNGTNLPLVVRKLGTEYSKNYGMFYTHLKTPTFADPIEKGKSLIMPRDSHLFYTKSKNILTDKQLNSLKIKYCCSDKNLKGQTIFIDTGSTKMKFPPNSGNLDPLQILTATSQINGLLLKVR